MPRDHWVTQPLLVTRAELVVVRDALDAALAWLQPERAEQAEALLTKIGELEARIFRFDLDVM